MTDIELTIDKKKMQEAAAKDAEENKLANLTPEQIAELVESSKDGVKQTIEEELKEIK